MWVFFSLIFLLSLYIFFLKKKETLILLKQIGITGTNLLLSYTAYITFIDSGIDPFSNTWNFFSCVYSFSIIFSLEYRFTLIVGDIEQIFIIINYLIVYFGLMTNWEWYDEHDKSEKIVLWLIYSHFLFRIMVDCGVIS
jgi:hypothetical protein